MLIATTAAESAHPSLWGGRIYDASHGPFAVYGGGDGYGGGGTPKAATPIYSGTYDLEPRSGDADAASPTGGAVDFANGLCYALAYDAVAAPAGAYTVLIWLRHDTGTGYQCAACYGTAGQGWFLFTAGGAFELFHRNSGGPASVVGGTVATGAWQVAAIDVNAAGTAAGLWVDGTLRNTLSGTLGRLTSGSTVHIGSTPGNASPFFGAVARLAIVPRALTSAEHLRAATDVTFWPTTAKAAEASGARLRTRI